MGWQTPSQEPSLHINNVLWPRPEQEVIHLPHCVDPAGHTHWAPRGWGGLGQVPTLCSCPGQVGNHIPALLSGLISKAWVCIRSSVGSV